MLREYDDIKEEMKKKKKKKNALTVHQRFFKSIYKTMLTYCLNVKKTDTVNPQNCKDKKKKKINSFIEMRSA